MADARKPCRCTLLESGQADMAKLVRDYVDSLSADEKTDEATYAARLNICRTCDNLHSGTCALCGCYVEARAAKKRQGCPKVPEKWGAEEAAPSPGAAETHVSGAVSTRAQPRISSSDEIPRRSSRA